MELDPLSGHQLPESPQTSSRLINNLWRNETEMSQTGKQKIQTLNHELTKVKFITVQDNHEETVHLISPTNHMNFENKLAIGKGCYTASEIAHILQLPYYKVHMWMVKYWDGKLGKEFETKYSWKVDNSRAVSFHTLVEFYVMMQLSEAGVKPKEVLKAHTKLANDYNTAFPFAQKALLEGIQTDGSTIYLKMGDNILSLDGSNQLNLDIIKDFFKKLDFDDEDVASRFWPMGKDHSIVVDPERKFGHAILNGHNIYPEVLCRHIDAGDPEDYVALIYELTAKEVKDAVEYCRRNQAA